MIVHPDKIVAILGTSYLEKIPAIQVLLPGFQEWFVWYMNDNFHTGYWLSDDDFTFNKEAKTIVDANAQFLDLDVEFANGIDIHVQYSKWNDGFYWVNTAASGTLTLDDVSYELEDETSGAAVTITRIKWPRGIDWAVAKAIEFELGKSRSVNEAPARQNPFDSDKERKYPKRILDAFPKPRLNWV